MGRKTYTREFKLDAVRLVTEQFYSVSQAYKALEIGETVFRRWLSQDEEERRTNSKICDSPSVKRAQSRKH